MTTIQYYKIKKETGEKLLPLSERCF